MTAEPFRLGAAEATRAIAAFEISSEDLTTSCLRRIAEREAAVQAWAHLDPERALAQAREADARRARGEPLGPLHGVPVGVKDIIDTADMPTENGTVLHEGRRPDRDASIVSFLREAGAVILGKTVTTELAVYAPGKTRNPHDPEHTPGGSSSGSAAAVADFHVPLALGTQTNGSVIRPASFCGVVGYKPTHGLVSRAGVLRQSRLLDHVGLFARSVEDAALLAEALLRFDPQDPDMRPVSRAGFRATATAEAPLPPRFAFVRTPMWEQTTEETREGFAELADALGDRAEAVELPPAFAEVVERHRTIMEADLAASFADDYRRGADRLSGTLRGMIERGREVRAVDYMEAAERRPAFVAAAAEILHCYDAILTPATPGAAPRGLESTGSPVFCTIWTYCGLPAVSLPLLQGGSGLPIGVQLVGRPGDDARLLRTARWLAGFAAG